MSWSLKTRNGDLSLEGGQYETVTYGAKLVQDMSTALRERLGHDKFHPEFGSTLDGGRRADGTEIESIIGSSDPDFISLEIQAELFRIAHEYQVRQLARAKDDRLTYGRVTLSAREVLDSITNIQIYHVQDAVIIRARLASASGSFGTFDLTLGAS